MRLKMTALVASALAGFLYVSVPSASALPAPSRGRRHHPRRQDRSDHRGGPLAPPRLSPLGLPQLWLSSLRILWLPPAVLLRRVRRLRVSLLLSSSPGLWNLPRLLRASICRPVSARPSGLALFLPRGVRAGHPPAAARG